MRLDVTLPADPWFAVSRDAAQVLFGDDAAIFILSTLTGGIERVQLDASGAASRPQSLAWRTSGEFSYVRRIGARNELVLRRRGTESVLSSTWPARILGPW